MRAIYSGYDAKQNVCSPTAIALVRCIHNEGLLPAVLLEKHVYCSNARESSIFALPLFSIAFCNGLLRCLLEIDATCTLSLPSHI
jgi:hypothetical protein